MYTKRIMDWTPKWCCHGWTTASGKVGHRDLWEANLLEHERAGDLGHVQLVPSHLGVEGNHEADRLAEHCRLMHPNNIPKSRCVRSNWEGLGLVEMPSSGRVAHYLGASDSPSEASPHMSSGSDFSTAVSDRAREMVQEPCLQPLGWESDYSINISDSRKRKGRRVFKSTPEGG